MMKLTSVYPRSWQKVSARSKERAPSVCCPVTHFCLVVVGGCLTIVLSIGVSQLGGNIIQVLVSDVHVMVRCRFLDMKCCPYLDSAISSSLHLNWATKQGANIYLPHHRWWAPSEALSADRWLPSSSWASSYPGPTGRFVHCFDLCQSNLTLSETNFLWWLQVCVASVRGS